MSMAAPVCGWSQTKRAPGGGRQSSTIEYRSIDGSGNNFRHPNYNAAGADFARIAPAHFADGIWKPVGGPNPRMISNVVLGQGDADVVNPEGLSGMMYAWGQFVAHDLDLGDTDSVTHIDIHMPNGDPVFPDGTTIPVTRAIIDPATASDRAHPAVAVNAISGWLDASMIYGSDAVTAAKLRLPDGHMRTSAGGNLPIADNKYLAGDIRAAETPPLTALHTLFVREHNHQVDLLREEHPAWSGDHLYQQARAIVTAEIQHITYSEFLPHLLGPRAIPPYRGYDPSVDPRITLEFAGAAFRFGHSIVANKFSKFAENGTVAGSTQTIAQTFFESPAKFAANSGADGVLRFLAADPARALDARIVDGLRNHLSDPPDTKDLAAINIQRARDLGLGTLNQTRIALGLTPYTDFRQITNDAQTLEALRRAYTTVDDIDLWTGGLSENHVPGAMVGETFQAIIAGQFQALRDGDRLWFENQGFDSATLNEIEHTSLADIILRNTNTKHIQPDVFVFYQRISGLNAGIVPRYIDAPMLVIGSDGGDALMGGLKDDYLIAGSGRQILTGGGGADTFVFGARGSDAIITDFKVGTDALMFRTGGEFGLDEAHVTEIHGNATISAGLNRILLLGVSAADLENYRFLAAR